LTADSVASTRTGQDTLRDPLRTERSRPTAPTTNQAGSARTARAPRTTTYRILQLSFGDVRLSALRYEAKASKPTYSDSMQTIYSISCPPAGNGRRVIFKTPLRMGEEDRVLRTDSPATQEDKREQRFARLKVTRACAHHFPNWEGATLSATRRASCERIAKELSKLVVCDFDEC
jgi:hypothetical protein